MTNTTLRCDACEGMGGFGASDAEYTRCNKCKETGVLICDMCRRSDRPASVLDADGAWCSECNAAFEAEERGERDAAEKEAQRARDLRLVLKIHCGTHPVVPR